MTERILKMYGSGKTEFKISNGDYSRMVSVNQVSPVTGTLCDHPEISLQIDNSIESNKLNVIPKIKDND